MSKQEDTDTKTTEEETTTKTTAEETEKPVLTMATMTHQAIENLVVQETTPKKNLSNKTSMIFKIPDSLHKKKIVTPKKTNNKKKKKSTKTTQYSTEKPKENTTMTQIYESDKICDISTILVPNKISY